jgi:hypothetical protein
MMNKFVATAKAESVKTKTENGANAYNTTGDSLVDLFGVIGSLRGQDTNRITKLFADAYADDALLATKMAFYARNVRGGLGERETFRTILKYMAQVHPQVVLNNMQNIAHFGRWDDLYVLVGTSLEDAVWATIRAQFILDAQAYSKGQPTSIMAKWLKSVNTSSVASRTLGKKTAKALGLTEAEYRKTLAKLRAHIDVVEQKMSAGQWNEIDYEGVPSRAMAIYRDAFKRHGMKSFEKFIEAVEKGEATIKAATLYPYDIFEKMGFQIGGWSRSQASFSHYDRVLEAQWKALPNYVGDGANFLVMADTSGSMSGRPVCTSVGLATYFAERNHGAFKDMFMTFSSRPSFVTLKGDTLFDKIKNVPSIVENTNLEAAFELVLKTAIQGNVPAEDMPKAIVVISDGEIDSYMSPYGSRYYGFLEVMRQKFRQYGYALPNIVMWNVASRENRYLAQTSFQGVQFASGQNPSVFKSLIANMGMSAYDTMVETLSDPMYDCITL